eukprot:COSAG02_NODE_33821_length_493_cov_1198.746193_1_plen_51_part_10
MRDKLLACVVVQSTAATPVASPAASPVASPGASPTNSPSPWIDLPTISIKR